MSESVNLSWKMAVQKADCIFAYFCGGHKNNFWLQFRSSFNKRFHDNTSTYKFVYTFVR